MSREVRRVPLDFEWPLGETWEGYFMPARFAERDCPDCKVGYAPEAQRLYDQWYGHVPFDPASTGSTLLTAETPTVRAFAERQVRRTAESEQFYKDFLHVFTVDAAIVRESERLAAMWNGQWGHHLAQVDVDALVAADRLRDFTHTWSREDGWQAIEPAVTPTAAQVNEWSILGFGHDSINASIAVRARAEREGLTLLCPTCEGRGSLEAYEGQREEAKAWEAAEPPEGDGFQLWETVSDGSPVTPVYPTAEALINHLATRGEHSDSTPYAREAAKALVEAGSSFGTGFSIGDGPLLDAARNADKAVAE